MTRTELFNAIRPFAPNGKFTDSHVKAIDALADSFSLAAVDGAEGATARALKPSQACINLMHEFEGCRLKAYPDPGSRDGKPWTIGWGSTGPDIGPGTVWTQAQADARFASDVAKFADKVSAALGDAHTTQHQFDAMVSFAYNVGVAAFSSSTLLKKHKAGDYSGAFSEFARWNKNDGKVMAGLTRRRAAEADLYDS